MEGLRIFWSVVYVVGCGSFLIAALAIAPLGLRDLRRLLSDLRDLREDETGTTKREENS